MQLALQFIGATLFARNQEHDGGLQWHDSGELGFQVPEWALTREVSCGRQNDATTRWIAVAKAFSHKREMPDPEPMGKPASTRPSLYKANVAS